MKNFRKNQGITLIALVITVIVLLILAGVTIVTLTGDNGILTRAQEAKNKTEQAQKDEENILDSYENLINEYAGIDWDTVLANAEKHPDQKTSTAIGVGTNGRVVNMDLWEYNFDDATNGYGLNDSVSLITTASAEASKGYSGTDFENIVIPQYISIDNGENWTPVTNLDWLFYNCIELKEINQLPDTVKSMRYTFRGCINLNVVSSLPTNLENMQCTFYSCKNLITIPIIPEKVTNMVGTFNNCSNLIEAPTIPNNVLDMRITFAYCTSLETIANIPNKVETLEKTFQNCSNLKAVPTIPESVTNMSRTFLGCSNLNGEIIINANITGAMITETENDYHNLFGNAVTSENCKIKLLGTCPILEDIINYWNKINPNIT